MRIPVVKYQACDHLSRIIIIGPSGAGKSCLIDCYNNPNKPIDESKTSTIGVEFATKIETIEPRDKSGNKSVKLQIWDTAGQERFQRVNITYYRDSQAVILVFDLSKQQSLTNLQTILNDQKLHIPESAVLLLVGNKSDTKEEDQTWAERAVDDFIEKHNRENTHLKPIDKGQHYFQVSAKNDDNVQKLFQTTARLCYQKFAHVEASPELELEPQLPPPGNLGQLTHNNYRSYTLLNRVAMLSFIAGASLSIAGALSPSFAAAIGGGVILATNVCLPWVGLAFLALTALIALGAMTYQISKHCGSEGFFASKCDQIAELADQKIFAV